MPPEENPEIPNSFNFLETDPRKNFAPWFLKFCIVLIVIGLATVGYFKYQAYQIYKSDQLELSQTQVSSVEQK